MAKRVDDKAWVKNSLMLPYHQIDAIYKDKKVFSSAYRKFTDTTPGGNLVINPPPQFTRYADLKAGLEHSIGPGSSHRETSSRGMGRRYSETIDDNSQVIHMRFGVPQFNTLWHFFNHSFDWTAASLSRSGREPGWFYDIGRVTGYVVTLPVQPLILAGHLYRFLTNKPSSKFYFLKPAMPLYWNAVNTMVNSLAVYMGIIPRVFGNDDNVATNKGTQEAEENTYNDGVIVDDQEEYTKEDIRRFHNLLPRIFREDGGIDVYSIATRAQRIANAARGRLNDTVEAEENSSLEQLASSVRDHISSLPQTSDPGPQFKDESGETGIQAYLRAWKNQPLSDLSGDPEKGAARDQVSDSDETEGRGNKSFWGDMIDFFKAELDDGSQFVSFRVNHTGEVSESFTNSVGESEISQTINGTSAQARTKRFSFAEGNIGGILDEITGVGSAVMDFAAGALDTINLEGLMAFAGNAYTSIPKVWEDSAVQLPQSNYRIELRTPYGNKMSRLLNLYIPMCMILAGAMPKSTGKHSYDAPFLVEIYDRGRRQVRLGMIDQISITRGTGNVGWTQDHEPLGIDIDFTVADLETALHMPINASIGLFDEDTAYNDYLAALGGLSLADQIYQSRKLKINMTRKLESWRKMKSPGYWSTNIGGQLSGRALGRLTRVFE